MVIDGCDVKKRILLRRKAIESSPDKLLSFGIRIYFRRLNKIALQVDEMALGIVCDQHVHCNRRCIGDCRFAAFKNKYT